MLKPVQKSRNGIQSQVAHEKLKNASSKEMHWSGVEMILCWCCTPPLRDRQQTGPIDGSVDEKIDADIDHAAKMRLVLGERYMTTFICYHNTQNPTISSDGT